MTRQCYLVSQPLDSSGSPARRRLPDWTAIGNGKVVPRLLHNFENGMPLLEHWAVCVLPANTPDPPSFDLSAPSARIFFIRAEYFELGAGSESQSNSGVFLSQSHCVLHHPTRWPELAVRTITSVQWIGWTNKSETWLYDRSRAAMSYFRSSSVPIADEAADRQLLKEWGTYRPILWNCQEFAILMAQMAVNSKYSVGVLRRVREERRASIYSVRFKRNLGFFTGGIGLAYIPVIGPVLGLGTFLAGPVYMLTDAIKDGKIEKKLEELADRFPELQRMFPPPG